MSQDRTIVESLEIIVDWWRSTSLSTKTDYTEYFKSESSLESGSGLTSIQLDEITKHFPFKITREMRQFYQYWNAELEVACLVFFLPIEKALETYLDLYMYERVSREFFMSLDVKQLSRKITTHNQNFQEIINKYPHDTCLFPIFRGYCKEFYYIGCRIEEVAESPVWVQYPGDDPIVYSDSLSTLLSTFAECYQNGAFYFDTDSYAVGGEPEENLEKFEVTFEKYNHTNIDTWRKLHKSYYAR
jgi:hypothetical protein